jgi:hypothetical protein
MKIVSFVVLTYSATGNYESGRLENPLIFSEDINVPMPAVQSEVLPSPPISWQVKYYLKFLNNYEDCRKKPRTSHVTQREAQVGLVNLIVIGNIILGYSLLFGLLVKILILENF